VSQLTRALGRAHAVDILRALGASSDGLPFNTIRRLTEADSRSTAAILREFTRLGIAEKESGRYRLSPIGTKVLSGLAQLHADSGFPW
jgi:DNA-binding IclR family transcriptional regulator